MRVLLDVLLAILGVALFIYADLTTNRALRIGAALVMGAALVIGLALGVLRRDHEE